MKSILKGLRAAAIMLCLFVIFDLLVYHKLNLISNLLLIAVGLVFIVPLTLWKSMLQKLTNPTERKLNNSGLRRMRRQVALRRRVRRAPINTHIR